MVSGKFIDGMVLVYSQYLKDFSTWICCWIKMIFGITLFHSQCFKLQKVVLFCSHTIPVVNIPIGQVSVIFMQIPGELQSAQTEQNLFQSLARGYLQEHHTSQLSKWSRGDRTRIKGSDQYQQVQLQLFPVNGFELPILPVCTRIIRTNTTIENIYQ